eukprot:1157767-Pelagomonas_calceolata.AAC.15
MHTQSCFNACADKVEGMRRSSDLAHLACISDDCVLALHAQMIDLTCLQQSYWLLEDLRYLIHHQFAHT